MDANEKFYTKKFGVKDCDWVETNPNKFCKQNLQPFGKVRDKCPNTCGTCPEPEPETDAPVTAPVVTTATPSMSPTVFDTCRDATDLFAISGVKNKKSCNWASNADKCNKSLKNEEGLVSDKCPKKCDACPEDDDLVSPTDPPEIGRAHV